MRQFWTRASGVRIRLVAAATLVIALGSTSPIYSAASGSHQSDIGRPTKNVSVRRATNATCSRATAAQAMARYKIGVVPRIQPRPPIAQVLCGPFLGPGSQGMVASVAIPSCGISIDWAVFRYTSGAWRLVMNVKHGAYLYAASSDIREEQGVLAPGDAHCFPSSVKYRFWHWDGSRLRAGPWATALSYDSVLSPDRQTWCKFSSIAPREVFCGQQKNRNSATLRPNGTFTVSNGGLQNWDDKARVLMNGQADEWGGFSCLAGQTGVACTVIGGKAAGRGFLINSAGITAVMP
jgi:hypothetical protein